MFVKIMKSNIIIILQYTRTSYAYNSYNDQIKTCWWSFVFLFKKKTKQLLYFKFIFILKVIFYFTEQTVVILFVFEGKLLTLYCFGRFSIYTIFRYNLHFNCISTTVINENDNIFCYEWNMKHIRYYNTIKGFRILVVKILITSKWINFITQTTVH